MIPPVWVVLYPLLPQQVLGAFLRGGWVGAGYLWGQLSLHKRITPPDSLQLMLHMQTPKRAQRTFFENGRSLDLR